MDDPFGNNPTPAWGHTGQEFSPVATEFTVIIKGTIGVVTVTGAKLVPNGSCPTIIPV